MLGLVIFNIIAVVLCLVLMVVIAKDKGLTAWLGFLVAIVSMGVVIEWQNRETNKMLAKQYSGYENVKQNGDVYVLITDTDTKRVQLKFVEVTK